MELKLEFLAIRNEGAVVITSVVKGVIGRLEKRGGYHTPLCYADKTEVITSRTGETTIIVYARDCSQGSNGRVISKRIIKTLLEIRGRSTGLHYFSKVIWKKESPNLFSKQPEYERIKNEEASESDKEEIMDVPFEESESKEEVSASEPIEKPNLGAWDIDIDKVDGGCLIVALVGKRCSGKSAYIPFLAKKHKDRRILYLDTERPGWSLRIQLEAIARFREQSLTELANDEKFSAMSSFAKGVPQDFETLLDYFLEVVRTHNPDVLIIDSLEELIPPSSHDVYEMFRRLLRVASEVGVIMYVSCTLETPLADVLMKKSDGIIEFERGNDNKSFVRKTKCRDFRFPPTSYPLLFLTEVYKQ